MKLSSGGLSSLLDAVSSRVKSCWYRLDRSRYLVRLCRLHMPVKETLGCGLNLGLVIGKTGEAIFLTPTETLLVSKMMVHNISLYIRVEIPNSEFVSAKTGLDFWRQSVACFSPGATLKSPTSQNMRPRSKGKSIEPLECVRNAIVFATGPVV